MIKSTPSSPQPGLEKRFPPKDKKPDAPSHLFHLPQLKYIHKLPAVSPRLKRVLSLKNSLKCSRNKKKSVRRKSSDERQIALALEKLHRNMNKRLDNNLNEGFDNDIVEIEDTDFSESHNAKGYKHSLVVPKLNVIAESTSASDTESDDTNAINKSKATNTFADVVIKLLRKTKQEHGYSPVDTQGDDTEDLFHKIEISNISDVVSCANNDSDAIDSKKQYSDRAQKINNNSGKLKELDKDTNTLTVDRGDIHRKQRLRPDVPKTLAVPKIVLSRDANVSSR